MDAILHALLIEFGRLCSVRQRRKKTPPCSWAHGTKFWALLVWKLIELKIGLVFCCFWAMLLAVHKTTIIRKHTRKQVLYSNGSFINKHLIGKHFWAINSILFNMWCGRSIGCLVVMMVVGRIIFVVRGEISVAVVRNTKSKCLKFQLENTIFWVLFSKNNTRTRYKTNSQKLL